VPSTTRRPSPRSGSDQPDTSSFFVDVSGRSHSETWAGCIVSLTTRMFRHAPRLGGQSVGCPQAISVVYSTSIGCP
jgi:hypothetical protein